MTYRMFGSRKALSALGILVPLTTFVAASRAADDRPAQPRSTTHGIVGLCCREREDDLRGTVKAMPNVTLVGIDFEKSEATFLYDPARLFPQEQAAHYTERFDNLLRSASSYSFSLKPPTAGPVAKLTLVEIPVVGLDCKGCCLGTYNAIAGIGGVDRATASYKEGRVTAWIDPSKTNRAALEDALKKAGVTLKAP